MKSSLRLLSSIFCFLTPLALNAQPVGGAATPQPPTQTPPGGAAAPGKAAPGADNPAATAGNKENRDENVEKAFATLKEGKEEETIKQLKDAIAKNPNLPPVRLMLHRMYLNLGKLPQARQALEQSTVESGDHPDVYVTFGEYALREARFTDAYLEFQKAMELMKDEKKWNETQRKNVLLVCYSGLSRACQGRNQWEESRRFINEALKLDFPKNQLAIMHQELGKVYFMLDRVDEARAELQRAQQDEPNFDPPGVSMARMYTQKASRETNSDKQKEFLGKAKEWLEFAIKQDPKSFKARLNLAVWLFDYAYLDKANLQRAQEELEEAGKLEPKQDDIHLLRGLIQRWMGNYEAAESEFDVIHTAKPTEFAPANQLALSLLEQPAPAKQQRALSLAEANYKAFAGRLPNGPEATATLGWILYRNGRSDDAEKVMGQALQSGQISADMLYYFSKVLQNKGQLDRAAELLKAAVNSPGRFMYRREATLLYEQISGKATSTAPSK
jgi:tetratricopeptide (TPR) repeat protein